MERIKSITKKDIMVRINRKSSSFKISEEECGKSGYVLSIKSFYRPNER